MSRLTSLRARGFVRDPVPRLDNIALRPAEGTDPGPRHVARGRGTSTRDQSGDLPLGDTRTTAKGAQEAFRVAELILYVCTYVHAEHERALSSRLAFSSELTLQRPFDANASRTLSFAWPNEEVSGNARRLARDLFV